MARYILIDSSSGFIWGDSADLNGTPFDGSPIAFAEALDQSNGEHDRTYTEFSFGSAQRSGMSGYFVYRVDHEFPVVRDGQDQDTIDAVEREGERDCFIGTSAAE